MGGGDLNMKKSWHPLTMQNLERVWKAEQRHEAEQKRIAELQQEIKEERAREEIKKFAVDTGVAKPTNDRVDWLYRGPIETNKEEYLLGKRIDKSVDPTLIENEREKEALASGPGSLFAAPETANSAADLEMKIREDPLFLMKKKEEEAKKRLLNNPVKMKQLQQILSKEKDKKRKHKSSKKRRTHHDSSSSGSDTDDEIEERHHKGSSHRREHSSSDHGTRDRSPLGRSSGKSLSSRGSDRREYSEGGSDRSRRPPPVQRKYGATSVSRKMDPKELERRRKEMMSFAKDRDKERESRLRHHEAEVKREEQQSGKQEQFMKKLRVQSITSSKTVEDRIHRHINSVQRTKASFDDFMNR